MKQKSDHFDGKRFFHRWSQADKSFWTVMKWQFTSKRIPWPKEVANTHQPQFSGTLASEKIELTFVNHATVYIRHSGLRFVTDPQWSERASPVSFAGPKRVRKPGVEINQLPGLDYVFISHNHYDHLDTKSLQKLKELYDPTFFIPLGDGDLLKEKGISKFKEFDWWDEVDLGQGRKAVYVPVKHWSARSLSDKNESLWGGFVIVTPSQKIFFAGDTGYCDIFVELAEKFGGITLSLLPVGAYEPRWFMKDAHMNPEEAVQAHIDLKSEHSMGIHYGTFQLTDEGIEEPLRALDEARRHRNVDPDRFFTLEVGQTKIL